MQFLVVCNDKYVSRKGLENLQQLSCTDLKCTWKNDYKKSFEQYVPTRLKLQENFKIKENEFKSTPNQVETIRQIGLKRLLESSSVLHHAGRHAPKKTKQALNFQLSQQVKTCIANIFARQTENSLHDWLSNLKCNVLPEFQCFLKNLEEDPVQICENTLKTYQIWKSQRRFRITGSRCYELYTYSSNKNPDWVKKCQNYFDPSDFSNKFTKHGLDYEGPARDRFSKLTNSTIVQTGLIVSKKNPWLAYSPDGVIIKDDQIVGLLEIKCPFKGKDMNINEAIQQEFKACLDIDVDGNIKLKKNTNTMAKCNWACL